MKTNAVAIVCSLALASLGNACLAQSANEAVVQYFAARPPLRADIHLDVFNARAGMDPRDPQSLFQLVSDAGSTPSFDYHFLCVGRDRSFSLYGPTDLGIGESFAWVDGCFTANLFSSSQFAIDVDESRFRPDTFGLLSVLCGRIPQSSVELEQLAQNSSLVTTEITADSIAFESAAPVLEGRRVFGRLDRTRGNLPSQFGWEFIDGSGPLREEVEILEAQEIDGHWLPLRARIVWNNGPERENMVYDFVIVSCSRDDSLTSGDLILRCPTQNVSIFNYVEGRLTSIGPDGAVLRHEPLIAAADTQLSPSGSRAKFAGIPTASIAVSLAGVACAIVTLRRTNSPTRAAF